MENMYMRLLETVQINLCSGDLKKKSKTSNKSVLILALTLVPLTSISQPEFSPNFAPPIWSCELQTMKLSGFGVAIGGALSYVHGKGNVHCSADNGSKESNTPVNVQLSGFGIGIGYVDIKELDVLASANNLVSPIDLFGKLKLGGNSSFARLQIGSRSGKFMTSNSRGDSVSLEFAGFIGSGAEASVEVQSMSIEAIK